MISPYNTVERVANRTVVLISNQSVSTGLARLDWPSVIELSCAAVQNWQPKPEINQSINLSMIAVNVASQY